MDILGGLHAALFDNITGLSVKEKFLLEKKRRRTKRVEFWERESKVGWEMEGKGMEGLPVAAVESALELEAEEESVVQAVAEVG